MIGYLPMIEIEVAIDDVVAHAPPQTQILTLPFPLLLFHFDTAVHGAIAL